MPALLAFRSLTSLRICAVEKQKEDADHGRCFYSRATGQRFAGAETEYRIRVPELRAVQEHECVQEHRLWVEDKEVEAGGHQIARRGVAGVVRLARIGSALSTSAFGR